MYVCNNVRIMVIVKVYISPKFLMIFLVTLVKLFVWRAKKSMWYCCVDSITTAGKLAEPIRLLHTFNDETSSN